MSGYSVEIVRDAPGLRELAAAWEALFSRASGATPFQSPRWLIPWWAAFAPGELFTLAVWRDARLVGLAPLYMETGSLGRRVLPLGISVSDYLDVLIDPQWFEPVAQVLVEQLNAADGSWDVCELSELAPDADALRLPGLSKCQDIVAGSQSCPVLALPDTPEQLRYSLPPRKVRHWRMARNRAARRGEIKFETADPTTARFLLAQVIRLHQARWERQGESGVFADPQVTRFHYDAIGQLVDAGLARIYTVEVGGSTVGAYYGFVHRGRAFAYVFGFDPEWAFESPGTILIWHAIEQAIREGAREFHFLRGREAYKYRWGAKDRWNRVRTLRRAEVYADAS